MTGDYLWQHQWDRLDRALAAAGCHPSNFEQREHVYRQGWLGQRELRRDQQYAGLLHNTFGSEIYLEIRAVDPVKDADGDLVSEGGWIVKASPSPDDGPRRAGAQVIEVDDFDEVIEVADEWAVVAARELQARGVRLSARQRAADEWNTRGDEPLALSRLSGFVREDLPRAVEETLQRAGVDADAVRRSVEAVRADSDATIAEAEDVGVMGRRFPEIFARHVGRAIAGKVTSEIADLVIEAVWHQVRSKFPI